ncbi:unnamed protein product [Spirodela intermedia]|uniref:Uncharacterized protein n=1 Tax=Spirodela intermedia TaxID=51605 RepID=A0A7I8L7L4_SPIIN|nr:unnamed protein product [Spirodela intermedia]
MKWINLIKCSLFVSRLVPFWIDCFHVTSIGLISHPTLLPSIAPDSFTSFFHRSIISVLVSCNHVFSDQHLQMLFYYLRIEVCKEKAPIPSSVGENDLLIVGPGVLGRIVAEKWKKDYPGCQVFGQTLTTDHHDELRELGVQPLSSGSSISKFPFVIFCAPPSKSLDYTADVRSAASNWSGEGSFLFTSSTAAYDCNDNGPCNEDSPIVPIGRNRRTDVILNAENAVLEASGCSDRGAHVYWLGKGSDENRPDHILNLIHYEDAASLSIAILKKQLRGRIFMGCDNHPLSRQEIMDYVNKSGKFDRVFDKFTGTEGPLGKRLDNSKTRAEIGWEPKYSSFPFFLDHLTTTRDDH